MYTIYLKYSRASCQKKIEEKVTPLLAKIVAFADTNNNLSVLEISDNEHSWIAKLWLGIFSSVDVEHLKKNTVPQVMTTGADSCVFSASFPFSWLIYETVERVLLVTSENVLGMLKYFSTCIKETNIYSLNMHGLLSKNISFKRSIYVSPLCKKLFTCMYI